MAMVSLDVQTSRMTTQILSLDKDGHSYVFRYSPGSEDETVDEIMRLAGDANTNLDWMDAAKLSFQIAQQLAIG